MHPIEYGIFPDDSDYFPYQPSTTASKVYLYPVALGHFHYQAGYRLKRSSYNSFLLMYIEKGCCQVYHPEQIGQIRQDQLVLIDCYIPHEYGFPEESNVCWIHFDGPLARNYYELITVNQGNVFSSGNLYPIVHDMNKILNMFRNSEPIKEARVSSYITQMLSLKLMPQAGGDNDQMAKQMKMMNNTYVYLKGYKINKIMANLD